MQRHEQLDARGLAMHRLVVAKVRREPALFERARRTLRRWRDPTNPSRAGPYLAGDRLMERGIDGLPVDAERRRRLAEQVEAWGRTPVRGK